MFPFNQGIGRIEVLDPLCRQLPNHSLWVKCKCLNVEITTNYSKSAALETMMTTRSSNKRYNAVNQQNKVIYHFHCLDQGCDPPEGKRLQLGTRRVPPDFFQQLYQRAGSSLLLILPHAFALGLWSLTSDQRQKNQPPKP